VNFRRTGEAGGARLDPADSSQRAFVNEQAMVAEDPDIDGDRIRHHHEFERLHRPVIAAAIADTLTRLRA
jgi:hypothetical protein